MAEGFKNTPYSGQVRSVIFQENGEWFGAALEFNIVESGGSPQEVTMLLDEAILGYIEGSHKSKLSIKVLNQEVDPEYEALWKAGTSDSAKEREKVYKISSQSIPVFA